MASALHELLNKTETFKWNEARIRAFEELKTRLISPPILTHYNPKLSLYLFADASGDGLGAILFHVKDNVENPIAYFSRSLNQYEKKLGISEKELLSIIFGISKCRQYLFGKHFVVSDHLALRHVLGMKDPHGRLARWSIYLSQFHFIVIYRTGRKHTNCDVLSRNPLKETL